jgi:hypothetical protein
MVASRAMAERIQPMALLGRWATISAPTTMKAAKASRSGTESVKTSRARVPLATDSAQRAATLAVHTVTSAQATQVERRLLVRSGAAPPG